MSPCYPSSIVCMDIMEGEYMLSCDLYVFCHIIVGVVVLLIFMIIVVSTIMIIRRKTCQTMPFLAQESTDIKFKVLSVMLNHINKYLWHEVPDPLST